MTQLKFNFEFEEWKDIPGWEEMYQASTFGNIRSIDRTIIYKDGRTYKYKGVILSSSINTSGYLAVGLAKDNKIFTISVHQLIACAFLNHKINGYKIIINHIDRNKLNNHVSNLEICTARYNTAYTYFNKKTSSIYTGVRFNKKTKAWFTSMTIQNKEIFIHYSKDELICAKAYEIAVQNVHKFDGDKKKFRTLIKILL